MLHLDIKPSNILLDGQPDGPWDQVTPMIADFGIARAGDSPSATASGLIGVGGTPSFMAPEQIAGDRAGIGRGSDVFALGATLYNLLTGRPPFQAASAIETLDLVRTRDPAPPRTLVPGLPRDLETIALTCLRPLVIEEIDAGAELVRSFHEYMPVDTAFWLNPLADGGWALYIASPGMNVAKYDLGFAEILKIVRELQTPYLAPSQVRLVGSDDPMIAVVDGTNQATGQSGHFSEKTPQVLSIAAWPV